MTNKAIIIINKRMPKEKNINFEKLAELVRERKELFNSLASAIPHTTYVSSKSMEHHLRFPFVLFVLQHQQSIKIFSL